MLWENDKYKELKYRILDDMVKSFDEDDAKKITLGMIYKVIDEKFEILLLLNPNIET